MTLVKKSIYPSDSPSAQNGPSKVMGSPEAEWVWEKGERHQPPRITEEVSTHRTQEEPFPKGNRGHKQIKKKIQPVSGIAVHRIMHHSLIRYGR